ncbi:acyl-CoA dehydrogenase [Emcibacter sp. SYSU 3D8]|uniref:acyl-CoA dehydrogenase n=1 Tax=Emcibacter sp. SYSU 3D8 TaxID=3133969 RepID=UPI0031FE85B5
MTLASLRRRLVTRPIFDWARAVLPAMSATEREALEAGDTWWDAALFTGDPDWDALLATPPATLSDEERAFLDGPVQELCAMVDDWTVNQETHDLPPEAWAFIRRHGFFGMIIPREYGGLGFSAFAHSEVVRTLSTRSVALAVTVMVPNSLGPGELLMHFGTDKQREYWLPRLAVGEEIPCFGLTSPEAGSDAASMVDTGVVCRGDDGELGIRLNWHKRYITLGPVATVLGLAFNLRDPDGLLGGAADLGITVALIPTDTPGVEIGRRHIASGQMFQNGPNWGRDVFVSLDNIIGGAAQAGKGWKMLMAALAAGRGISLPSLAAAGAAFCAHTTGAYARVRRQFGIAIGKFEGVQEPLARIAANAYLVDAARRLTCAGLDLGHKPSVISGIMKLHATERMRICTNDAMDVHAGKAVIDGPLNYLGNLYKAVPVGITVEGANILTRGLIVFGQGAIRCHPYLIDEMAALEMEDRDAGLAAFDAVFWKHAGHSIATFFRAMARAWTSAATSPAPDTGAVRHHYRRLGRYAAGFALSADLALMTLGGALKRREMLSARLGDILAELYLLSAVLKRWEDEGRQAEDLPLVDYCMAAGFTAIESSFEGVFANLPSRFAAGLLKFAVQPFGARRFGPDDALVGKCADLLLAPSATRDRLTEGLYHGHGEEGIARLDHAFAMVFAHEPLADRMRKAGVDDPDQAQAKGIITQREADKVHAMNEAVAAVIAVDDFAAEYLTPEQTAPQGEQPSPPSISMKSQAVR